MAFRIILWFRAGYAITPALLLHSFVAAWSLDRAPLKQATAATVNRHPLIL